MAIENRLPQKQEAQSVTSALGFISIRLEVIGQCRRHQNATVSNHDPVAKWAKAASSQGAIVGSIPTRISTSTVSEECANTPRIESNTAEATSDPQPIIGSTAVELKRVSTVICSKCQAECKRHGRDRYDNQRFKCRQCGKTYMQERPKPLGSMSLSFEKAESVLRLLLEGNSVSSVERLTEVHKKTILKLLVLAGEKAERVMAEKIVNVPVRDVEMDEVWSFIGKKQKRVRPQDDPNLGDCYTFVAIERHTKLVLNIAVGKRDQRTTDAFVEGVRHATRHGHFQITTDGFAPYRSAVTTTLYDRCDYAMLIKVYANPQDGEKRYSPPEVASTEVVPVMGRPDSERICTSIVERRNLSLRMGLRRFTRLTNAFSKKWENHAAAVMLWYCWYNFGRIHKSLRVTPAMAAGISGHVWSVGDILRAA